MVFTQNAAHTNTSQFLGPLMRSFYNSPRSIYNSPCSICRTRVRMARCSIRLLMETLKAFPKYYTHESEDMKRSQHKELVAYKQNDEWT